MNSVPATQGESSAMLLRAASERLAGHSSSPRLDAELLLAHLLGGGRERLYRSLREPVSAALAEQFAGLVARRAAGTPVAYLTGVREFWSLPLVVTPATLIPRPETELLVERALALLPRDAAGPVLDLGTGSGAIALAMASERPQTRITAVDNSAEALAVARQNAAALGSGNIRWQLADWYQGLPAERHALILSNPPYISAAEWPASDPELSCEPMAALRSGADGLDALRLIIAGAPGHLAAGGWLLTEHGATQGPAVRALFADAGLTAIHTRADLAGHERFTEGCLPG